MNPSRVHVVYLVPKKGVKSDDILRAPNSTLHYYWVILTNP